MRKLSLSLIGLGILMLIAVILVTGHKAVKQTNPTNQQTVATITKKRPNQSTNGKAIVIYMTHTGNTEAVAKTIQQQVGADSFRLRTKETYPTSYQKMLKVARAEQNSDARPELSGRLPDLKKYTYIFLGYPIWLNKNPMAINTFLSHYSSFKGKTILPFTTSGSSGLGASLPELKQQAKHATFRSGLAITDSQLADRAQLVKTWLKRNKF